jgi:hypothetical protein
MGTCASVPQGTVLSIHFTDYVATSEYKLYQKAHPSVTSASVPNTLSVEPWRDMLQKLHLPYICRKQTLTQLPPLQLPLQLPPTADLCVGISVRDNSGASVPFRLTVRGHLLLSQGASADPDNALFAATDGTYRSCLYYTPSAEESPAGLVVLTEALPLKALANTPVCLELVTVSAVASSAVASSAVASSAVAPSAEPAGSVTVELLLIELPAPLSAILQRTRGRIHLRSKDWLYDPAAIPAGFFPDLPF